MSKRSLRLPLRSDLRHLPRHVLRHLPGHVLRLLSGYDLRLLLRRSRLILFKYRLNQEWTLLINKVEQERT